MFLDLLLILGGFFLGGWVGGKILQKQMTLRLFGVAWGTTGWLLYLTAPGLREELRLFHLVLCLGVLGELLRSRCRDLF